MKLLHQSFFQPKYSADGKNRLPRVKICGITNRQDAVDAIELGADALGFNLYTGSKRYVDLNSEGNWIRDLPPDITKVAVMVNPTIAEAEGVFKLPFIDMVQFHGDEDEKFCAHFATLGLPFIKAVAVKDKASVLDLGRFGTPYVLIDAYSPAAYGGTGKLIDATLLDHLSQGTAGDLKLILSGGLKPDNVRAAVERIRPHAVDVASGVEKVPRRKEKGLMAEFIHAVS